MRAKHSVGIARWLVRPQETILFKHPILLDQALVSGGNFFLGLLLANLLPSSDFGQYVLLWIGVQFASSLQMALLVHPLYTNVPQRGFSSAERYISAVVTQNKFFVVLAAGVFLIYSQVINLMVGGEFGVVNFLTALVGVLFLCQDLYRRVLIIRRDMAPLLFSDLLAYTLPLVLLIGFSRVGNMSLLSALIIVGASFLFSLLFLTNKVALTRIRPRYAKMLAFENWKQSKYLFAASVLQLGGENIFPLTAGAIIGPPAAAAIRVVQNLMGGFHIIFVTIETQLAIRLAALKKAHDLAESARIIKRCLGLGGLTFLVLFLLFGCFEKDIFHLVYGDKYVAESKYLKWFSINYCFIFITIILKVMLRTAGSSQIIFKSTIVLVSINLLVAAVIVRHFGTDGAIAGLLISNFIYAMLLALGMKRRKYA